MRAGDDSAPQDSTSESAVVRPGPAVFGSGRAKSHVLYVSPAWARDRGRAFDAEALVRQLVDCGVDCIELYAKDHHGNTYFPTELGVDYGRDIVGETQAACAQHGVAFVAYLSVCFDERIAGGHPDWLAADGAGRPRSTGPFRWLCLRTRYRQLILAQVETLAERYDIDGLWLDILPLAWPGPYTSTAPPEGARVWMLHDVLPCYCHACRVDFATEMGRELPLQPDPQEEIEMFEFGVRGVRSFLEAARGILDRLRPAALMTYNGSGAPGDPIDAGDLVSIEGHAPHYGRQDLIARWARGQGRPFEVLTAGSLPTSPSGWNGFDRKPGAIIEVERAITMAHGGSTAFGHAPFPDGHSDPTQFDGLREAGRRLGSPAGNPGGQRNVAEILLGSTIKPLAAPRQAGRMLQGLEWWNDVLRGGHHLYDIGTLDRELSSYALIVLPDQLAMSDPEIDAIRDYVGRGGRLLSTGGTSRFDGNGHQRGDFGLADVYGATGTGLSGTRFTYITAIDPAYAVGMPGTPLVVNREATRLNVTGGRAILRTADPERPFVEGSTLLWGYPPPDRRAERAIGVAHEFGRGSSVFVGVGLDGDAPEGEPWATGGLESMWARRLADNLVRSQVRDPLLRTDAPSTVEIVLSAHADGWLLHLVNHAAGDPRYLPASDGEHRLSTIHLSLDADRIEADTLATRDGRIRRVRRSSGRIAFEVEHLGIADQVTLPRTVGDGG